MAEKGLDFSKIDNTVSQTDYLFSDIKAQMKMAMKKTRNPRGQLGIVNDFAREKDEQEMMKERQTIRGAEEYFNNVDDERKYQFSPYEYQVLKDVEKAYEEYLKNNNNNTENQGE